MLRTCCQTLLAFSFPSSPSGWGDAHPPGACPLAGTEQVREREREREREGEGEGERERTSLFLNAEVIGAMVSVLIIWVLTGVLLYEAVLRVIHRDFEVNADIMLITACVGVFVNVL